MSGGICNPDLEEADMTIDRDSLRKKVEKKLELKRDERAIAGFLRSLKANLLSGGFAIILGVTLLVGPLYAKSSLAKSQFPIAGLFFICIGWTHLMAYRQGKAIRALINRMERLSERLEEEGDVEREE